MTSPGWNKSYRPCIGRNHGAQSEACDAGAMARVLLTGADGYIGVRLGDRLLLVFGAVVYGRFADRWRAARDLPLAH